MICTFNWTGNYVLLEKTLRKRRKHQCNRHRDNFMKIDSFWNGVLLSQLFIWYRKMDQEGTTESIKNLIEKNIALK